MSGRRVQPGLFSSLMGCAALVGVFAMSGCAGDDGEASVTDTEVTATATATMTAASVSDSDATTEGSESTSPTTTESSATDGTVTVSSATLGTSTDGTATDGTATDPTATDATATDATATDATTTGGTTTTDGTTGVLPEGCSDDAVELVALVNAYRAENGKPAVPLSPSLCTVGEVHAQDLVDNDPDAAPECNLHSWSNAGSWSPCCYTADHAQAKCMWDKPKELTVYPGNGYENAAAGGGALSPAQALDLWKGSPGHNAVILSEGIWKDYPWGAVGAGFQDGYALLWFGQEADPAG